MSTTNNFCTLKTSELKTFIKDRKLKNAFKNDRLSLPIFLRKDNCTILKTIFPDFVHRITGLLGSGNDGTVFATRGPGGEKTAVKIATSKPDAFKRELDSAMLFHLLGVAPPVLDNTVKKITGTNVKHQFLSMGRVDGVLIDYFNSGNLSEDEISIIVNDIFKIINILDENNVAHGDMHIGNVGFIKKNGKKEIQLIDFGMTFSKSLPKLDIIQLIRVNHFGVKNIHNRDIFDKFVREMALNSYDFTFPEFKKNNKIDSQTVNILECLLRAERRRASEFSQY